MFPKSPGTKIGYRKKCKLCYALYMKNYYKKKPRIYAKHKKLVQNNDAKYRANNRRHGVTDEEYAIMKSKFNGLCWACQIETGYAIDHDHACCAGSFGCEDCVRGYLCLGCNTALGFVKDDIHRLQKLIEYLNRPGPNGLTVALL